MRVTKRNGQLQLVHIGKIQQRIERLSSDLTHVDPTLVCQKVVNGLYDGVPTTQLDTLAAETAAALIPKHYDYDTLAARLAVSNLHAQTQPDLLETLQMLGALIDPSLLDTLREHRDAIQNALDFGRDFGYDYFGFKTLCKSYLLRSNGNIVERPQHMLMRVSLGIHGSDLPSVLQTYHMMSTRVFTHASPTLFNSGTKIPQMSSCFLLDMTDDSIDGIYETLARCAKISKCAGGIGVHLHRIRAMGTSILGTNGVSNGLPPMLKVYNSTARYVDQGGGKRKGAFAMYLEPWHADIFDVLELRKNTGSDELRARDLFYALWMPDLFYQRVENDEMWSLMCPKECPGLAECYGDDFNTLYTRYESEKRYKRQVKAQELMMTIVAMQIEAGVPYLLNKDQCNLKNNQSNLGTLRGSNLCAEIVQYTSPDEVAVCNLASISLKAHVLSDGTGFNHQALIATVRQIVFNLNRIIDRNYYPVPQARTSNLKHRPMGIGVQGLQDVFFLLRMPFDSPQARALNRDIFETIYFAACGASCELAEAEGVYETYHGSPMSQGKFQFDLWGVTPQLHDWQPLRERVAKHGMRNSLLVALMPTASTSQILGNTECFEPITTNLYVRSTLAGEFQIFNRYLVNDLIAHNLWDENMKRALLAHEGSVQHIERIPQDLKDLYKTVYEIKQRVILDMAADRAPYVDQTQSMNLYMAEPTVSKVVNMHLYAWKLKLKTCQYYLHTKAAVGGVKFTIAPSQMKQSFGAMNYEAPVCEIGCDSCGS